jgi:hypothetical protein
MLFFMVMLLCGVKIGTYALRLLFKTSKTSCRLAQETYLSLRPSTPSAYQEMSPQADPLAQTQGLLHLQRH